MTEDFKTEELLFMTRKIGMDLTTLIEFYLKNGGILLSDSLEGYIKVIDQTNWYKSSDINYDQWIYLNLKSLHSFFNLL